MVQSGSRRSQHRAWRRWFAVAHSWRLKEIAPHVAFLGVSFSAATILFETDCKDAGPQVSAFLPCTAKDWPLKIAMQRVRFHPFML
jgi:hypothetical protein